MVKSLDAALVNSMTREAPAAAPWRKARRPARLDFAPAQNQVALFLRSPPAPPVGYHDDASQSFCCCRRRGFHCGCCCCCCCCSCSPFKNSLCSAPSQGFTDHQNVLSPHDSPPCSHYLILLSLLYCMHTLSLLYYMHVSSLLYYESALILYYYHYHYQYYIM